MRSSDSGVIAATDLTATPVDMAGTTLFRREGEYWTVTYHDAVLRLRDCKGLRYIAHLLRQPGTRFAARDLIQSVQLKDSAPDSPRPTADTDERARLGVTKRIKAAVKNIETHHPALGYHLST